MLLSVREKRTNLEEIAVANRIMNTVSLTTCVIHLLPSCRARARARARARFVHLSASFRTSCLVQGRRSMWFGGKASGMPHIALIMAIEMTILVYICMSYLTHLPWI